MRDTHRPLFIYREISLIACFLLFSAFILFLLVSLSLPIIKSIHLLVLRSTVQSDLELSLATELKFGVWGVCTVSAFPEDDICYGPMLGYTVPNYVITTLNLNSSIVEVVEKALLTLLVLHPIAGGLCLFSLFFSLFLTSHAFSIFTLFLTIVTSLVSSLVLAIDLALVVVAKSKLTALATSQSLHFAIDFGNGVWMILAAVILTWLAVIALSARACYCLGVRRHPRDTPHHHHHKHEHEHEHEHHDDKHHHHNDF